MARSKAAPANTSDIAPASVSAKGGNVGFYKKSGDRLLFAPTKVHYPGGVLEVAKHTEYPYPVEGWNYYESKEVAYAAEGLEIPAPPTRESIAEKIAARRAMTPEEKEVERAQRDAERIARLQERDPEKAAQLQKRLEERQERMAQRAALAAMSPEERRVARRAEIESKHPELAAKRQALEEQRAARLSARKH